MDNPGTGWRSAWSDLSPDNDVFVHEIDALVAIDLTSKCTHHAKTSFCLTCLPLVEKALKAARVCLDPAAEPVVEKSVSTVPYPEKVALVNESALVKDRKGFTLGSPLAKTMRFAKPILTSMDPDRRIEQVLLARHVTQSRVCDAVFMSAFSVRLDDATPAEFAKKLWDCRFTFMIDGEKMVYAPLREILQQPRIVLRRIKKTSLFSACGLVEDGGAADGSDWLGYFLPNGTVIEAWLEGIPGGGGLVKVHTQWEYADYTTREMKKQE